MKKFCFSLCIALTLICCNAMAKSLIGAYHANATCAEFSRHVAKLLYNCGRPYGYCYGSSGDAYRTTGSMESTEGVWDGAVPYVLGPPQAIPNDFAVRMHALRILKDKIADIVDALEPGGSGNPYATLNAEQRQVLHEATGMWVPIRSWYGWKK